MYKTPHMASWFHDPPALDNYPYIEEALTKLVELTEGNLSVKPISDGELIMLYSFLKETSERLAGMGPVFRLAANETKRLWTVCDDYLQVRSLEAYPDQAAR